MLKLRILFCLLLIAGLNHGCAAPHFTYPDPDVSIDNMKRTVEYLCSVSPPRNYANTTSLNNSADYIQRALADYGLTPREQTFDVSGGTYRNIIASVGPEDNSRVIVGAHYDVSGDQPGADDNASAVAGLLEVARFAARHASKLPYRVDFVAFTLEEPPFFGTDNMGSYVHAKSLHDNNVPVHGMISLEMIGFFSEEKKSQRYPLAAMRLAYPGTGDFIAVVSNFGSASLTKQIARHIKATSIKVETLKAPSSVLGVDLSDHRNYWKFGYDAVMVTDTAFYRNPNYHKPTDTIDTLDFDRMAEVVKGICWSILNMK